MQIYSILFIIYYDFLHVILPSQLVHCLSAKIWSLSAHPILSLPRNHTVTIKISASYLEKSLWTSKLLISTFEIHRHFVAFNCPPFCLLFSKPTLTVSFGKYQLSIIFSLISSEKLFLEWEITLTTNEIVDLACVIVCVSSAGCTLGTPWNRQMLWTAATVGTVSRDAT